MLPTRYWDDHSNVASSVDFASARSSYSAAGMLGDMTLSMIVSVMIIVHMVTFHWVGVGGGAGWNISSMVRIIRNCGR